MFSVLYYLDLVTIYLLILPKKKNDRTVWMMTVTKVSFTGRAMMMPNLMYCSVLQMKCI